MNYSKVLPNVWHIEEDYRDYCTFVQGEKLAILWDTGQGKQDLRSFVRRHSITSCLVLCSHGHPDHIGGNAAFEQVMVHPDDRQMLFSHAVQTTGAPPDYEILPLLPGRVFDLGGLHGRVVSLAGHTRGSVGLLLEEPKLLLAGDGLNPTLLLLGRESAPLPVLKETLQSVLELPFERYLSSHSPTVLPKEMVKVHLHHLDHLRTEPPSHPGPYGPKVCRSGYREASLRSVIYLDSGLAGTMTE